MLDDPGSIGSILLFVLLTVFSAYFSGMEISLASVNRIHMITLASKDNKSAKRVLNILENFDEALSVLLIGNNLVNIGCATLAAVIATKLWGEGSISIVTVVTTVIIFIFGEMLPKCYARSCNESFALKASALLTLLMKILKPVSLMFTKLSDAVSRPFKDRMEPEVTVTEDELLDIVENISEDADFDKDTGKLVRSAMEFSRVTVGNVMVPFDAVDKIYTSMKTTQILDFIKQTRHSRLPVVDRRGNIKGILQIRKFIKAYLKNGNNVVLSSVTDYPYFAKSDIPIDDLLSDLSNHKRNLAFIKDTNGTVIGIVTVEDILEELVGEIYDEDDIGGDGDA